MSQFWKSSEDALQLPTGGRLFRDSRHIVSKRNNPNYGYGVSGLATRSVRGADRAYDCLVAGFGLSVRKERDGGFQG